MTVDLSKGATVELVKTLSDDIRLGADGTIYGSAGDAVRGQIGDLKSDITDLMEAMPSEFYGLADCTNDYPFEQGGIDNVSGNNTTSATRIRTQYIPINDEFVVTNTDTTNYSYWIRLYDTNKAYVTSAKVSDSGTVTFSGTADATTATSVNLNAIYQQNGTCVYARLVVKNKINPSISITPSNSSLTFKNVQFIGGSLDDVYVKKGAGAYSQNDISVQYYIGIDSYYTKGLLKLPSNYNVSGEPVPMIVFIHGSADYGIINSQTMSGSYDAYYNYLRDEGFAIFDCYAWSNKYNSSNAGYANTWGLPINTACYESGINYICDHYNVDKRQIFVACKSLGGIQALSLFYNSSIPIKAFGLLAPELDILHVELGYVSATKKVVASELGFSEDTNGVLNFNQGDTIPEGFWDYITENMQCWSGVFSYFCGLPIVASDKPNYYNTYTPTASMARTSLNRPIKIWIAQDDVAVQYSASSALINSLINGGYKAQLRTMPNNTGGHHSVDTDANALQTTDVTTSLGIYYATIPTAYYELAQWFKMWRSR